MRFNIVALCLVVLIASGCASTIKKYDSTFTANAINTPIKSTVALASTQFAPHKYARSKFAPLSSKARRKSAGKRRYFIEFRARSALTYGHASVVFGRLDRRGKVPVNRKGVLNPKMIEISGLHPATPSNLPWSVGHVVPVPAETGPSDGDFEDIYVTARFRVNLTKREFQKVVAIVNKHKQRNKLWYAPVFAMNCLGYISSIAKDMNLKVPRKPLLPKEYVTSLKKLNS